MKAIRFLGRGQVAVAEVPDPTPDDQSVIVRVRASALCGSELYTIKADSDTVKVHLGENGLNSGHEVAGEIAWAPPNCGLKVGTRVGARIVQGCGTCVYCKAGDETGCLNKKYYGGNGHSELFKLGLQGVHVLPDGMPWHKAVMLAGDGLGVPARCARRLGDTRDKTVLVIGLGPVGLSCALVQAWRGAKVCGADLNPYRLDLVKKLGAVHTIDVSSQNMVEQTMQWTGGVGADIVIVAVPRQESLQQAFEAVRRHGTVFLVAEIEEAKLNFSKSFLRREATMIGSWYYTSEDWKFMLEMHHAGLPYEKVVTHVIPLERAQEGFSAFVKGESGKVVITY